MNSSFIDDRSDGVSRGLKQNLWAWWVNWRSQHFFQFGWFRIMVLMPRSSNKSTNSTSLFNPVQFWVDDCDESKLPVGIFCPWKMLFLGFRPGFRREVSTSCTMAWCIFVSFLFLGSGWPTWAFQLITALVLKTRCLFYILFSKNAGRSLVFPRRMANVVRQKCDGHIINIDT